MADQIEQSGVETEEIEPKSFTEEQLRSMSVSDFLALHPESDAHIDARAESIVADEMARVLPVKEAEYRELAKREQEDSTLEWARLNQGELDYYRTKNRIEQLRAGRNQKAAESSTSEEAVIKALESKVALPLAQALFKVDAKTVEELARRDWPRGVEGVYAYAEAVREALVAAEVKAQMKGRESTVRETTKKEVLSDIGGESPDVGNVGGRGPVKETYAWLMSLPLNERQAVRADRARYERIVNAG